MRVLELKIKNYRNLHETCIEFNKGTNVICGENAQGKTNIIEALWLLTGARSFRGTKEYDLIGFGHTKSRITAQVEFLDRQNEIEIILEQRKRTANVNGINRGPAPSIIGLFKSVIFSPEHLSLVKGGPENRRKFIDAAICQLKPTYTTLLVRYNKTLKQRNILLKDILKHPSLEDTLEIWDRKAAEYAGMIIHERLKYMELLKRHAQGIYSEISKGEPFDIQYSNQDIYAGLASSEISKCLLEKFEKSRKTDIIRGYTTVGAHRDELKININNIPARSFASQGQQRSAVIALKLAEAKIIGEITAEPPVILLDDILSELDENRQKYMFSNIISAQAFITGCTIPKIQGEYKMFFVEKGKISKTNS